MSKLEKLKRLKDQAPAVPDMSNVIKLAAKPNRYAIWSAKAVAFVLTPPRYRHLLPADVLETQLAFLREVVNVDGWRRKCGEGAFRTRLEKLEDKYFPGLMTHYVLRKRRIEELVRKEIAKGCKQVVSFGAGFDTLLPRLAQEYPDVMCLEADLPSTQKAKLATLKTRPPNLHFVDLNLEEPWIEKVMLEATPFSKRERATFIAEGVLMWLNDDDVERLLTFMQDNAALGSKFGFTFVERGVDHKGFFPEVGFITDVLLKLLKVEFGWGVRMEHVSRFLNDRYFGLIEVESPADLREKAPQPLPPCSKKPVGDWFAWAELVFIDESPTGTGPKDLNPFK